MTFRYDINALRGIAVIFVIFFHFKILGFSGGFAGVDIFFVISGFLMTQIIFTGLKEGNFSILRFYASRIRRIVPALAVLSVTLLIIGWFLIPPSDYADLGKHAASSVLFYSNFIYKDEAGYFDTLAEHKWLLHTWSLSVEWQFYILYPFILIAVFKASKNKERGAVITLSSLFILSLLLSFYFSNLKPEFSFYLLPTRMWEMVAGGLLFLISKKTNGFGSHLNKYASKALIISGLILIIVSTFWLNDEVAWPGYYALLPVVGAILFLLPSLQNTALSKFRALQEVGHASYSIYLWHWPLYVGMVYYGVTFFGWQAVGIILSIIFGYLSYIFIEKPFHLKKITKLYISKILGFVLFLTTIGFLVNSFDGVPKRFTQDVITADQEAYNGVNFTHNQNCYEENGKQRCVYGDRDNIKAILWGDSHAASIMLGLSDALDGGIIVHTNQCPVIFNAKIKGKTQKKNCKAFHEGLLQDLKEMETELPLIIVARFSAQLHGANEIKQKTYGITYDSLSENETDLSEHELYAKRLTETVCAVSNDRDVYVVKPIPEIGIDVPRRVVRQLMQGKTPAVSITFNEYLKRNHLILEILEDIKNQCGVTLLDTPDFLCSDMNVCKAVEGNRPLYVDDDHLSKFGNSYLTPMFKSVR